MSHDFSVGMAGQKPLVSCDLHPSGYMIAVALDDQIRLYHVLHEELRLFHSVDMKNLKKVRFTNGGQTLCITDYKAVHIFDTYTLTRIGNL